MCYLKDRKAVKNKNREKNIDVTCYNCQGQGHIARHCRKPRKHFERHRLIKEGNGNNNHSGNEFRPSERSSRPTVKSTQ